MYIGDLEILKSIFIQQFNYFTDREVCCEFETCDTYYTQCMQTPNNGHIETILCRDWRDLVSEV